jgi:hypothetical protein
MPSWYPGQVALGSKVFADPAIFAQAVTVQGTLTTSGAFVASSTLTASKGIATGPVPVVTSPGTNGPGTAVTNSTGYDCMVYASATTGISKAVISPGGTVAGTTPALNTVDYYVPSGASLNLTYTGTLTWLWLAI